MGKKNGSLFMVHVGLHLLNFCRCMFIGRFKKCSQIFARTHTSLYLFLFSFYVFKLCASSAFAVEEITFCKQVLGLLSSCDVSVSLFYFYY